MMRKELLFTTAMALVLMMAFLIGERSVVKPVLAQVRAALVQNVDEPGRTPFAMYGSANTGGYFFSVPAGQRYVVQNFTAECFEKTPGVLTDVSAYATTNGTPVIVSNQAHLLQSYVAGQNIYIGTGTQVLNADPGSFINVSVDDNLGGVDVSSCQFWVSGHVINNP